MTTTPTAREYLRVSQDSSGHLKSPGEQHQDNERAADGNGWKLGQPYQEKNGISASRNSSRARPGFGQLTADLDSGRFGAQFLILWESSRGSRRVGEWATLIDQLEDAGVKVHVTSHGHTYDPANARDRRSLLEDAVDSEYESGKASVRIRRAAAANAREGKPHGRVPFGYRREYAVNERGKRVLVGQFEEPAEAAVVRELFERLRLGHSLRAIARDFAAREIRTRPNRAHPAGTLFDAQHLRDLALRPIYAGLRIHTPGNRSGRYQGPLDGAVKAKWDGLIEPETFFAVRTMLQAPERKTSRPGRGKHLLSLIAACGVCDDGVLTITYRRGPRQYECRARACVRMDADELDKHAEKIMLAYLARPDVIKGLRGAPENGGELTKVRGQLAEARSELGQWRTAASGGKVTLASFIAIEPGILARISGLEVREQELTTPTALSVIPPGKDVARRWKAAPMSAKRQVARLLCSPAVLGTLLVGRTPTPGQRAEAAERVEWRRD